MSPLFGRKRRAVIATARRLDPADKPAVGSALPWQGDAWEAFERVSEICQAAQYYARALSRCEFRVERRENDAWVEAPDSEAQTRLDDMAIDASIAWLVRFWSIQRYVVGESLIGEYVTFAGERKWVCETRETLYPNNSKTDWVLKTGRGVSDQVLLTITDADPQPGEIRIWHVYRAHPRWSWEPHSPVRGVLDNAEMIRAINGAIKAEGVSRGGNGVLLIPDDVDLGEPEEGEQWDPSSTGVQLMTALSEAIRSPGDGSPEQILPVFLKAPAEALKEFRLLSLRPDGQAYAETEIREREIRRLAVGLDLPVEALLGVGELNHWSAWLVTEEGWRTYLAPAAEELCADLSRIVDVDPETERVWYDAQDVVEKPDRTQTAFDAHDRIVISDEALRRETGFAETDAPAPDEADRRVEAKRSRPDQPQPGPAQSDQPGEARAAAVRAVEAASMVALARCRELAGSRARNTVKADARLARETENVPNGSLLAATGPVSTLTASQLVHGGSRILAETLLEYPPDAVQTLCYAIEHHAAETLYESSPGIGQVIPVVIRTMVG